MFNLNLLRDLVRLGHRVTAVVHPDWAGAIHAWAGAEGVECATIPRRAGAVAGSLAALLALGRRRFTHVLVANVGDRLIPALWLLRRLGLAPRAVLIAHREPTPRFVGSIARMPCTVVVVNSLIASHFPAGRFAPVAVSYGITDGERFLAAPREPDGAGVVSFCVLGDLDRPWKGADTAVAAFRLLDEGVRRRCRLHLASFAAPPDFGDACIRAYTWIPFAEMPAFLGRMDAMLVPSRDEGVMRETFSQAAVQGMLAGLPLVVGRLPVLEEKVDEGGGIVAGSPAELARAMERLALDPGLRRRMGDQARETARRRYVWDTAAFVSRFLSPGATGATGAASSSASA